MSDPRARNRLLKRLNTSVWASEVLFCISCGEEVAGDRTRINVAGAHSHDFFDLQCVRYMICCFSAARGCRIVGEQTQAAICFPGYARTRVICQRCGIHLGWRFASGGGGHCFFGLIKARLVRLGQGGAN